MKFLPRLPLNVAITDSAGYPTTFMQRYWEEVLVAIENAVDDIAINVNAIQAALDAAGIATAAAVAANAAAATATSAAADAQTAADGAQTATDATARETSLTSSYVTGLTLTATDAGASVTVSISAHTRVYGDGTSVAVSAGSVLGQPYSSKVRVYYDQPSRAGGAVTYLVTVDPAAPPVQSGDRHSVGAVTTPAAAGPPATGQGVRPPGYVFD